MVSGQPDEQQTPGLNPVYSEACPPLSSQPGQCGGRSWWGQQRWPVINITAEMSHKHPGRLPTQHTITCPNKASAHAPPILLLASNQGRGCSRDLWGWGGHPHQAGLICRRRRAKWPLSLSVPPMASTAPGVLCSPVQRMGRHQLALWQQHMGWAMLARECSGDVPSEPSVTSLQATGTISLPENSCPMGNAVGHVQEVGVTAKHVCSTCLGLMKGGRKHMALYTPGDEAWW